MGAGKTTLGRALAATSPFRLEYVDLDELIERQEGMSVREIFATFGEDAFRQKEAALLRKIGVRENVVVGCGGGTPCHSGNMEWMNAHGLTVLLCAGHDILVRRLLEAQGRRPLLAGMSAVQLSRFVESKQRERWPFYSLAAVRFCSDRLENADEIDQTCNKFFNEVVSRIN